MNETVPKNEKLALDVAVPFGCDRRIKDREFDPQWSALERRSGSERRCEIERRHLERRSGHDRRSPERLRAEAHAVDRRTAERRRTEGRRGGYFRTQLLTAARDSKEVAARLLLSDDVVTTREYHCSRQSPRVYHVHAYEQGEYVGTYPVYRNEVNGTFLCTCAKFLLQFPNVTSPCVHVQRVEQFTGTKSS